MNELGKFVLKDLDKMKVIVEGILGKQLFELDFFNIEIVFVYKFNEVLKKVVWFFGLMNKYWLVGIGLKVGLVVVCMWLFFVESIVKLIIFE